MRKITNINKNWQFTYSKDHTTTTLDLPHNWNGIDGQDGGNDYYRGTCTYEHTFEKPAMKKGDLLYVEFKGVNSSCKVFLNGNEVCSHDGGYSTFRGNLTPYLQESNVLKVEVDNSANDTVYPQRADFTFYGGIYRDVNLILVGENHFELDYYGCNPIKIEPTVKEGKGELKVTAWMVGDGEVEISVYDGEGKEVSSFKNGECVTLENVHLWNGVEDPYLYRAVATLKIGGEAVDEISARFGFRTFHIDPKKGFFLNGKSYPLHGVSRHQDRPGIGNALTHKEHDEDMAMIKEIGANTIRLAHYQHDDYFYDLCDEAGMVIWAEIPYISKHMPGGNANTESQMKELILQQFNHPSIVVWGISNEITMMKTDKADMLENHRKLNDLCHQLDPSRLTTLACFAMCGPMNKSAHITDVVSWNLYLGWYVPGLFLNDLWLKFFHFLYPNRAIGYSEYGAEGMPNLHSAKPKRFDNTEEYQAIYHEYMLEFFARNPYLWSTHVWNMFDFAADGRDQGGDPGMNHKGLVNFSRTLKKDAFYVYKAYWSKEPVLHLSGKRYVNRTGNKTNITVYSNLGTPVEIYNNGKLVATLKGNKVFKTKIVLEQENNVVVKAGGLEDHATFYKVDKPDPAYIVTSGNSMSWEK